MTSFPVDLILLVALVVTSTVVVMLYLKLRALSASQTEYERAIGETAAALETAREAMAVLNREGRTIITTLGNKIDEAHTLIGELERRQFPVSSPRGGTGRPVSYERRS